MTKLPKIAHFVYSINNSSFKDVIAALVYKQLEQGEHADIVHIVEEHDVSTVLKFQGINIYTYTKSKGIDIKLIFKLARFLRSHDYQIAHTHSSEIAFSVGLAAKLARAKSIYSCHHSTRRPISSLVKGLNSYVVSASAYIQEKLLKEKHQHDRKVKLIYDGIDEQIYMKNYEQDFNKDYRVKLGLRDDSFVIGNIGPLIKEEDQATVIKAFRKLVGKGLNAELVFAGDGPLLNDLKKLAARFSLLGRIKFVPRMIERCEFLKLFDVLVHSANKECYPFILLEAMASGTPVIATKIGANAEVILERKTGYLVPCGFPERIDSAIMRLNAIKSLPQEMGEESKKHVQKDFTVNKMVAQYQELYVS